MTQNKKIIILILLVILAAVSLIYGITTPPKGRDKKSATDFTSVIEEQEVLTVDKNGVASKRQARKTDYLSWDRNPFSLKEICGGLVLNGILWDEEKPVAVINNFELSVGDKIEGNVVVEIKPQAVILNNGIENFELRLWQEEY